MWPGIDQLAFDKLLPTTITTELEHLNQERKNIRSTKIINNNQKDYIPIKKYKNKLCIYSMFSSITGDRFIWNNEKNI